MLGKKKEKVEEKKSICTKILEGKLGQLCITMSVGKGEEEEEQGEEAHLHENIGKLGLTLYYNVRREKRRRGRRRAKC